jgi:hypothetical protein
MDYCGVPVTLGEFRALKTIAESAARRIHKHGYSVGDVVIFNIVGSFITGYGRTEEEARERVRFNAEKNNAPLNEENGEAYRLVAG